jgi:predicted  nucleic acid-binding Zn-ribbon protein
MRHQIQRQEQKLQEALAERVRLSGRLSALLQELRSVSQRYRRLDETLREIADGKKTKRQRSCTVARHRNQRDAKSVSI